MLCCLWLIGLLVALLLVVYLLIRFRSCLFLVALSVGRLLLVARCWFVGCRLLGVGWFVVDGQLLYGLLLVTLLIVVGGHVGCFVLGYFVVCFSPHCCWLCCCPTVCWLLFVD